MPKTRSAGFRIGWSADSIYERNHKWAVELHGLKPLPRLPSEYIREHCYWGFQYNPMGVKVRHMIGVDHVMWSSDFPHTETDWPNSGRNIKINFKDVPENEKHQMLADNAVEFFHLNQG